jgi:hypothetical protein
MNDRKVPVTTYMVHLDCDCTGELIAETITLASIPFTYMHRCNKCGHTKYIQGKRYPFLTHEEVEPEPHNPNPGC